MNKDDPNQDDIKWEDLNNCVDVIDEKRFEAGFDWGEPISREWTNKLFFFSFKMLKEAYCYLYYLVGWIYKQIFD